MPAFQIRMPPGNPSFSTLIQLPVNADWETAGDGSAVWGPAMHTGDPGDPDGVEAAAFGLPGCCENLKRDPEDERSISLSHLSHSQ